MDCCILLCPPSEAGAVSILARSAVFVAHSTVPRPIASDYNRPLSINFAMTTDMTERTPEIDAQWLLTTLEDAAETLNTAITLIAEEPRRAAGVLEHEIPALYAKLNYAVNTARMGPVNLDEVDHDELISWPEEMPFDRHAAEDNETL